MRQGLRACVNAHSSWSHAAPHQQSASSAGDVGSDMWRPHSSRCPTSTRVARMPARRTSRDVAAALTLVVATVAVYADVRSHAFLNFDDPLYVTANAVVQSGLTWAGVRWALTATAAQNWHPITWVSHMTDVSLFGVRAGPHLMTNVALHALASVLCFVLFR